MGAGLLAWLLVVAPAAAGGDGIPSLVEVAGYGFDVVTVDGDAVPLATLVDSGRPVVIEFWATWCAPCRKTMRHLVDLQQKYGDRLVVLGLTVEDPETDSVKVRRFAEEQRINFQVAFAPDELFRVMNRRTDIAVPKLFVFDSSGTLVTYIPRQSPLTGSKLRSAVARALRF